MYGRLHRDWASAFTARFADHEGAHLSKTSMQACFPTPSEPWQVPFTIRMGPCSAQIKYGVCIVARVTCIYDMIVVCLDKFEHLRGFPNRNHIARKNSTRPILRTQEAYSNEIIILVHLRVC
jgi:hypothetical protein